MIDHSGLLSKRIFFGHQSVGKNILNGIASLQTHDPTLASLPIVETENVTAIAGPAIYHARIGRNRDISSKFLSFEELLIKRGIGAEIDTALMKLCYVDIVAASDVVSILKDYNALVGRLEATLPKLKLLHCTVPLTVHGKGFRRALRNLMRGDQNNIRRCEFNHLIRKHFPAKAIVDLARFESTREDGSRVTFTRFGREYDAAYDRWMEGSGHLNKLGGERVATLFLQSLLQAQEES